MHEQLGKDAILNSMPSSYLGFLDHWCLNRPVVNYLDLLGLLQSYECDHQLFKGAVNLVRGSVTGHRRSFRKGKKKKKNKKVCHAGPSQTLKKNKAEKSQAKCFHCRNWVTGREIVLFISVPLTQTDQGGESSKLLLCKVLI